MSIIQLNKNSINKKLKKKLEKNWLKKDETNLNSVFKNKEKRTLSST